MPAAETIIDTGTCQVTHRLVPQVTGVGTAAGRGALLIDALLLGLPAAIYHQNTHFLAENKEWRAIACCPAWHVFARGEAQRGGAMTSPSGLQVAFK